jgi:hypothetical protein
MLSALGTGGGGEGAIAPGPLSPRFCEIKTPYLNHNSSQQRLGRGVYVLTLDFEIPQVVYFLFLIVFLRFFLHVS